MALTNIGVMSLAAALAAVKSGDVVIYRIL
jgi:hypothetical protein